MRYSGVLLNFLVLLLVTLALHGDACAKIRAGVGEVDITPPGGFPMAGYYHERLATGAIDPLKAKAIVFREGDAAAAIVICDLIGVSADLSTAIRQQAAKQTGIPAQHIVVSATHSHTAPDYGKELFLYLGEQPQESARAKYISQLIRGPVAAVVKANQSANLVQLNAGSVTQTTPVAFNRRFVMRDGSVRTWMKYSHPDVIRAAGPVDNEIGVLAIQSDSGKTLGVLSNFALHLDTVGGSKWSADYPYFIERELRKALGEQVVSLFGTGCCGDINHSDPNRKERNKVDFIGQSIGSHIKDGLQDLMPVAGPLQIRSARVLLPLQDATREEVLRSVEILGLARRGEKVDFFDHVTAYKKLVLDQLRRKSPVAKTREHITWGLSKSLAGVGDKLPVDVTVVTLGSELAIVCLPGEVFVELGMAIKQASPFRTTMVIELSNQVETIYVPHRAAYAGGSYEVTNSAVQPGAGEMLVEQALRLLRSAAAGAKREEN